MVQLRCRGGPDSAAPTAALQAVMAAALLMAAAHMYMQLPVWPGQVVGQRRAGRTSRRRLRHTSQGRTGHSC